MEEKFELFNVSAETENSHKLSVSNFPSICRTCLTEESEIYEFDWLSTSGWICWPKNSPSLVDLLKQLVFKDESDLLTILPSKMCVQCCQQFYNITLFLQECKKSQDILKRIVNKNKNSDGKGDSSKPSIEINESETDQQTPLQNDENYSGLDGEMSLQSDLQTGNSGSLPNVEDAAELDTKMGLQNDSQYHNIQLEDPSTSDYNMESSDLDIVELNQGNLEETETIENMTESEHETHNVNNVELQQEYYEKDASLVRGGELPNVHEETEGNVDQFMNSEFHEVDFDQVECILNKPEKNPEISKNETEKEEQEINIEEYQNMSNIQDFQGNIIIYERPDSEDGQCTNYESLDEENSLDIEEQNDSTSHEDDATSEDTPEHLRNDSMNTLLPEIEGLGYMCSTCDSPFISHKDLMVHKTKLGHNLEQIFECPECEKKFYSYSMFYNHFQSHVLHGNSNDENEENYENEENDDENSELVDMDLKFKYRKPYTCKVCNLGLVSEEKLNVHTEKYHSSVTCENCQVTLPKLSLEEHKIICRKDKRSSLPTFPCKKCSEKFIDEKLLYKHISKTHSLQIFAKCEVCGLSCMGKKHLEMHMRKFHKDKECHQCGEIFQQTKGLAAHLATVHKQEPQSICEHCGKKFAWRTSMLQHVKAHHTGTPKYYCNLCFKSFLNKKLYTYHLYRHQGLTPFPCTYCERTFNNNDNLITHLKTHVEQTGINRCLTCDKSYFLKDNLRRHLIKEHGYDESVLNF